MSPLANAIARSGARYFAAPPPTAVATPITERLAATKAAMWTPKKSDPVEGLGLIGILSGTMFVCVIPGLWAALTPSAGGDH